MSIVSRSRAWAYPRFLGFSQLRSRWNAYAWAMSGPALTMRWREHVARICTAGGDGIRLRLALIDGLRQALGFRLKYLTTINRWTTLDAAPVALLRQATGGDLSRSL